MTSSRPKTKTGIASLPAADQELTPKRKAKLIFSMVTKERGTTKELRELVNHKTILELILHCVDMTKSARARVAASAKRKQHPIDALIEEIVRDQPKISAKRLARELDKQVGRGVIYNATDTAWEPEDVRSISRSGLKDRLTRVRGKIRKS